MKKFLPLVLVLSSTSVCAEGVYVLGGLGVASYDITQADADALGATIDTGAVMFKGVVGAHLNQNVSLEGGYTYLGSLDVVGSGFSGDITTDGLEAAVVINGNLDSGATVFGKIGVYAWDTEIELSGFGGSASASVDGSDMTFGFGIEKNSWRFEYQRYTLDDLDVNTFQVSYKFGQK